MSHLQPISARALRAAERAARDGAWNESPPGSLEEVVAGVSICRRCELWRGATQGVPGEGPASAAMMVVGEQPGDHEDLEGRPFVGPAGKVLDAGLERAGAPRAEVYITNAVKHFKHEPRGKRRLHKTPDAGEVRACRWWLEAERRFVRPRVVVALGATAALAVFGKPTPVGASRGRAFDLADGAKGFVTYHPSYLLRLPDEAAKKAAWKAFVADLRQAWRLAG
jgi:DNA polymerase